MSLPGMMVVSAYFAILFLLALFGGHRYRLLRLYRRSRARTVCPPRGRLDPLPAVTVQLPIYNEVYVVERLIRAACALEYPSDRLEIQILDDSDDETSEIAARVAAEMRLAGHDVVHLRRGTREGFKAGALACGLRAARGELVAIFDADFVPGPRFLLDLIDHFAHPLVGMVQARWGHLNRDYSLLTRLQSIFLDGHFVIEHGARSRSGLFFNFNGTAGIWRRSCIESAGGWRADTLTEDLDLSYRALLSGWQFVFAPEVVAPAELPADLDAFRSQQRRWARGSVETARLILPRLVRTRLPLSVKIEALFHLTTNGAYLLMVLLSVLMIPAVFLRQGAGLNALLLIDLPLVGLSTLSVAGFYLVSQREVGQPWRKTLPLLPCVMALGIGLALDNAREVILGFCGRRAEFIRTPKHALVGRRGDWRPGRYLAPRAGSIVALEVLLGLCFTAALGRAAMDGLYATLPVLALFQAGFLSTPLLLLAQSLGRRRSRGPVPAWRRAMTIPPG